MAMALPSVGSCWAEKRVLAGRVSSLVAVAAGRAGGIGAGTVTTGAGACSGGAVTTGGGVTAGGSVAAGALTAGDVAASGAAGTGVIGTGATCGAGAGWLGVCAMLTRPASAKAPTSNTSDKPDTAIKRGLMTLSI